MRRPIRRGMLSEPLEKLNQVRLLGSRCNKCGEVFFVTRVWCENCQSEELSTVQLSTKGKLWSYTVIRSAPHAPYPFRDNFKPFAVGWISLPDGLRILASITDCDIDNLKVGLDMELVVKALFTDAEGREIVTYYFKPMLT